MSTGINDNQKRNLNRPNWKVSLGISLLSLLVIASSLLILVPPGKSARATSASFGFSVAGDYGQTKNTTATLGAIGTLAKSGAVSFHLGLGDLNYDYPTVSAQQWSSYVKGYVPSTLPFEIIAGEHDTSDLDQLAVSPNFPDTIGDVSGTYAKEYYFDYPPPPSAPLARFIFASPGVLTQYKYNKGGADYNWVANTIDDARCQVTNCTHPVIPWVIVGIHKYCIAINSQGCTAPDLMNLLLMKKVDLILHGQKHGYQASYQLALNSNCPNLPTAAGSYNANCVMPNHTSSFTKGAGTIILITGTGGKSLSTVDLTDQQTNYFRTWMAGNVNPTWGVSQFSISANQLTEHFDAASGGNFTDSFTITTGGTTPSPSATASVTNTPSVTATVGTTLGQDNFLRPNQQFWGTATGGQTWAGSANSSNVFSISSNTGLVTGTTTNNYFAMLGSSAKDATAEFSGSISTLSNGAHIGAVSRWTDSQNWYEAYIDGTNLIIHKKVSGTVTKLGTFPFAATAATSYTLLFNVSGSTLNASVWPTIGGRQPSNWMLTSTDTSFASGNCGLHVSVQSGVRAQFTSFQATAP